MKKAVFIGFVIVSPAIFMVPRDQIMAARWPDTVHERFLLKGDQAVEFAGLFGISLEKETTLHFPTLGPAYSSVDENYGGKSKNSITFTKLEGEPAIILENEWNDSKTGTCKPVPQFWFLSPFIDPELTLENGWTVLLRHLNVSLPLLKGHAEIVEHIQIGVDKIPLLEILVYIVYDDVLEQWVYRAQIGIDERNPKERKEAMKRHWEFMKHGYQ